MKERPILFSAPMVRALLDGSKTQTRRVLKVSPDLVDKVRFDRAEFADTQQRQCGTFWGMVGDTPIGPPVACPYGQSGDRLRVRETFYAYGRWVTRYSAKKGRDEWHFIDMTLECDRAYQYEADNPEVPLAKGRGGNHSGWYKRPAIFMPRAACRILLEIVSVRVERLNDCSEADALAEGIDADELAERQDRYDVVCKGSGASGRATAQSMYRELWESINGAGSWAANPWVWVVEFKRVAP